MKRLLLIVLVLIGMTSWTMAQDRHEPHHPVHHKPVHHHPVHHHPVHHHPVHHPVHHA